MSTVRLLIGNTSDTTCTATAETTGTSIRLAISTAIGMTSPSYTSAQAPDGNGYVRFTKTGLTAGTRYYAALEIDGVIDTGWVNTFKTAAAAAGSPASFSLAFFSCAPGSGLPPSTHPVHDKIAARQSTINFHLGDFPYDNIATNSPALYRTQWKNQFVSTKGKALVTSGAFYYIWDDHDFGADNSDRTSVSAPAAAQVYREVFPHEPLVQTTGGIERAFTHGRFRFIVTDERYYRDPQATANGPTKTILGVAQKAWFKAELLAAKAADLYPIWVSSQPPHQADTSLPDWGAYTHERTEVWNFFAANEVYPTILAGDRHFMAYNRAVDYSTAQTAPCRVYVSSALEQNTTTATETWEAICGGSGQYAVLTVTDHTTYADLRVDFYHVSTAGVEVLYFSDTWTWGNPPPTPGSIHPVRNVLTGERVTIRDETGAKRDVVAT